MTHTEICEMIETNTFGMEQLNQLQTSIRFAMDDLGRRNTRGMTIGCKVKFTNKLGKEMTGTIMKISQKKVKVHTRNSVWSVPKSMVKFVSM